MSVIESSNPNWRTSALPSITPPELQSQEKTTNTNSITRYAYWSGRKRFDRCDACGTMETIQGEVRIMVNGVLTKTIAIGDCESWMFDVEQLTDKQKDRLLTVAEIECQ